MSLALSFHGNMLEWLECSGENAHPRSWGHAGDLAAYHLSCLGYPQLSWLSAGIYTMHGIRRGGDVQEHNVMPPGMSENGVKHGQTPRKIAT